MKETKDSFGVTRIYPYASADAEEKDYFLDGFIEIFTVSFLKGDERYGTIRSNVGTGYMTPAKWDSLNRAMMRAFDIQRAFHEIEEPANA